MELIHNGSAAQKAYVTLCELADSDASHVKTLAEEDAIPGLVDLLFVGETADRYDALKALWNLACLETTRAEIVDECALKAIIRQLTRGDSDEHCQLAASMLAILAKDDANDQKIGEAGSVVTYFSRQLRSGSGRRVWGLFRPKFRGRPDQKNRPEYKRRIQPDN